jgi:xanthine dehydrogenase accessory factor
VRAERPTSAKPGDRAIVLPDGTIEGFVGGSCAESTVRLQSLRQLASGESTLLRITPGGVAAGAAPMPGLVVVDNTCLSGGTIDIFLEAVMPPPLLQVYGDTPIARALVTVGTAAGYEVRLAARSGPVDADALGVVVASHGHGEEDILAAAVDAGVPYVALVASPKRGAGVLSEAHVPPDRVKTPAGLDLGARTPGDVAVSILAEVVAAKAARPAATVPAPPPQELLRIGVGAPQLETDPVCEMEVVVGPDAIQLVHDGQTYYFCAPGCRKRFAADPARFLA